MSEIVVVDYGSGNTFSILHALRLAANGRTVELSRDPERIAAADRVVLPGVGAFSACRRRLDESGVITALRETVARGRPFLGVCVGMQVLADEGLEFGRTPGLGWIPGITRQLSISSGETRSTLKLPHVGWNQIRHGGHCLFENVRNDDYFYFVHSYVLQCNDVRSVAAWATYGEPFAAAVVNENVFGCQFHPEKSAESGLRVLEAFCRWKP